MKKKEMEKEIKSKKGCLHKITSKNGRMGIKICDMVDKCDCEDSRCCSKSKRR